MTNRYLDGSIRFTTQGMSPKAYVKQLRALACKEFCRHCGQPKINHLKISEQVGSGFVTHLECPINGLSGVLWFAKKNQRLQSRCGTTFA